MSRDNRDMEHIPFLTAEDRAMDKERQLIKDSILRLRMLLDLNKSKSAPLSETLVINLTDFDVLKNDMETSIFKKNLKETKNVNDLKNLAVSLDPLEPCFGLTYLMVCAMFDFNDIGTQLISSGVDIDKQNQEGLTALIYACIYGAERFVETLLKNKANVNMKDNRHMNALMWAIFCNNETVVKMLLDSNSDVHCKTLSGLTSLHIAVEKNVTDIVRLLIDKNAPVDSKSADGWTPLMKSVHVHNFTISELLIENGADVHNRNKEGNTALHISCLYQSSDCVDLLLEKDADVNCKNCLDITPLMYASLNDNVAIIQKLFKKGALKSINDKCYSKRTAIFYAVNRNCQNVIDFLISKKADTNLLDAYGHSPLVYACQFGLLKLLSKLLENKKKSGIKKMNIQFVCILP